MLRSDKICFGELLEDLKKGSHKGRDEFLDTVTYAYEILIRTSRQIGMSTCQVNRFSSRTKIGGRLSFIFAQNDGRENLGKHKDQGNNAAHGYVLTGGNGVIQYYIK